MPQDDQRCPAQALKAFISVHDHIYGYRYHADANNDDCASSHLCNHITNSTICIFIYIPSYRLVRYCDKYIYLGDIFNCNSMSSLRQARCESQATDNQGQDLNPNCQYRRPLIELIES